MSAGRTAEFSMAARITRCWARPLGTVSPPLSPSWRMAVPRTIARIWSPSRRASDIRLSARTPQPSLRAYPSALSSNVLQCPSGASMPACEVTMCACGCRITLTAPHNATSHWRWRRSCTAMCNATSDDEHAVSTLMHGPCQPRK
jgi:hypothetical protein